MVGEFTRPWLLFDLGGVLEVVDDDAWPQQLWKSWAVRMGTRAEDLRERCRAADLPRTDIQAGTQQDYWRRLGGSLGVGGVALRQMREEFWDSYCGAPNDELIAYVRGLQDRAGLAILSNSADGAREQEERRFGLSTVFHPICYSHEQGVNKPDPRAYRRALARMGAGPEAVFFIDDHIENVDAAAACGIDGVLHRSNGDTIAAIERFLASSEREL
ncbi:MAG: HAD family hydrolase [Acidipropionibacterium sp.]|jgi:HAD superfamily hydrolase (TIGR01509 family)|nr:HAD family hydrolase [Acidipropionibacterium sp.]